MHRFFKSTAPQQSSCGDRLDTGCRFSICSYWEMSLRVPSVFWQSFRYFQFLLYEDINWQLIWAETVLTHIIPQISSESILRTHRWIKFEQESSPTYFNRHSTQHIHSFSAVTSHSAGDLGHLAARSCFSLSWVQSPWFKGELFWAVSSPDPSVPSPSSRGQSALTAASWYSVSGPEPLLNLPISSGLLWEGEKRYFTHEKICSIYEECQKSFASLLIKWCFLICTEQHFSVGLNRYSLVCWIGMNKQDM